MAQEYVRHYKALGQPIASEDYAGDRTALFQNSEPDRLPAP
jgi:hypothetical protein